MVFKVVAGSMACMDGWMDGRWVDLGCLSELERRATFINVYNSLIIHGLAVGPIPTNLMTRLNFYSTVAYEISGHIFSLDDIEHGVLRGNRPSLIKAKFFARQQFRNVSSCLSFRLR